MRFCVRIKVAVPFLLTALLLLIGLPSLISTAMADEFTSISDAVGCRVIARDSERLRCYDTVTGGGVFNQQKVRELEVEEFGSEKMAKPTAKVKEPVAAPPPESASVPPIPPPPPENKKSDSKDSLLVMITRTKKDSRGFVYFQTEDGQVWKQQSAGSWTVSAPFEATIRKGTFGSFFLVSDEGRGTRVKRLK